MRITELLNNLTAYQVQLLVQEVEPDLKIMDVAKAKPVLDAIAYSFEVYLKRGSTVPGFLHVYLDENSLEIKCTVQY